MIVKKYIRTLLKKLLSHNGYELVAEDILYEWQKSPTELPSYRQSQLPEKAAEYLVHSNPVLKELQVRYSKFNNLVTDPLVWTNEIISPDELLYFRGDNAYVWQLRGQNMNVLGYALTTYYIKSIDQFRFLETLEEDDLFGNYCFNIDNKQISRDLLDSILEIYFLEKHLKISAFPKLSVLDVGAGYGRLAHRILTALPNIVQYLCTDAFPVSTFICEYYLKFRGLEGRAKAVPLDEIEHVLESNTVDIAVNIHSFSECRISAIDWWVSILAKCKIRYLMIVPNSPDLRTNEGIDFSHIVEKHGYKLIAREPKYLDPVVQVYAINPSYYHLFELC